MFGTAITAPNQFDATDAGAVHEVVPSRGEQFQECRARPVLCRPKLLPLQSMSLEKLERLQAEAQQRARQST
ncbi:unnamed protein product [Ixodes persulcatus]